LFVSLAPVLTRVAANGVRNRNNGTGRAEALPLAANEQATKNRVLVARFMRRCFSGFSHPCLLFAGSSALRS